MENIALIEKLNSQKTLTHPEWLQLLTTFTNEDQQFAAMVARKISTRIFGHRVYFRGIIEFTNYCHNDCLYCGIRCSNRKVTRYRLTPEEIVSCCHEGYQLGYRTFVLQGGEDNWFDDSTMISIIKAIHHEFPDCAITLSIGEKEHASYQAFYDAGAERYLLRHETADNGHYTKLHPPFMSWQHRMDCLKDLKAIGYQTGCGMMIGSPFQTPAHLVKDMMFIHDFKPHMIGIGPFIPHQDTPFKHEPSGNVELTLFILSLCRIMLPTVLLPSTTALGSVEDDGRQRGILAGCNVIMPNLSPLSVREKYLLYDNKAGIHDDAQAGIRKLTEQMNAIGYQIEIGRGDFFND